MDEDKWVDELLSDLALKYRIIVSPDDPVLVSAILNREIIEKAAVNYRQVLSQCTESFEQIVQQHEKTNEVVVNQVCDRLIEEFRGAQHQSVNVPVTSNNLLDIGFIQFGIFVLVFLLGIVAGILISIFA